MDPRRAAVVRAPDEGHYLGWQGGVVAYKALSDETGGRYCLSTGSVPRWSGPPASIQTREDRGFFILEGELAFAAGNQKFALGEGSFLNVRRGTALSFINSSRAPASVLVLNAPGGFDRFQVEAGQRLEGPDALVPPVTPADTARMDEAAPRYGIDLSPPAEAFRKPPALRVTRPSDGRSLSVLGDLYRFLAVGADTDGSYALWEALIPGGGGPPLHVHSREDEGFFVLEGEVTFRVEERTVEAGPGTFLNLPPGVRHTFSNESAGLARMLIMVAPAGLEKMFQETGSPLDGTASTLPPVTPEDINKILAAAPRYGITIFPSP